jgi:hypothetical protein
MGSVVKEWPFLADMPSDSPTSNIEAFLVRVSLSNASELPNRFDSSGSAVFPSCSFFIMSSASAILTNVVTSMG